MVRPGSTEAAQLAAEGESMLGKSPEVRYLDNLLDDMRAVQRRLNPTAPDDADRCEGHIASTLATLVSLRVIAEVVAVEGRSAATRRRVGRANMILTTTLAEGRQLAVALNLSWDRITDIGREEALSYLEALGGDTTYQHELSNQYDFARIRREAARSVLPDSQSAATSALFWTIIGPAFGQKPTTSATNHQAETLDALADKGMMVGTFLELRAEAARAPDRASAMGLGDTSPDNPWRRIVEGPDFLAHPTRPLSDHTVTFDDIYQLRLADLIDTSAWISEPQLNAVAHAQVLRFSFMLQSTDLEDRCSLIGVTKQDVVRTAQGLYTTALRLLDGGDYPSQMTPRELDRLLDGVSDEVHDIIGKQHTNPVVAVADSMVAMAGALVLFEELELSLTEGGDRPSYAAFALAMATLFWGESPFRDTLTHLSREDEWVRRLPEES